ncbi:hypothetical protein V6N12_065796 [Hibiscus sabdariffa]|uniref:Uncharacterized protein n=1 Tax=Hibiscus sabdariffa TaxID=183260 RepID=A0ABR2G9R2_9ROSI
MPNKWHTPLEVPGNRLPETGSRRKLLNVRGAWAPAEDVYIPLAISRTEGERELEENPLPLCSKSSTRRRLALL